LESFRVAAWFVDARRYKWSITGVASTMSRVV
jgi:hypothetical protein